MSNRRRLALVAIRDIRGKQLPGLTLPLPLSPPRVELRLERIKALLRAAARRLTSRRAVRRRESAAPLSPSRDVCTRL